MRKHFSTLSRFQAILPPHQSNPKDSNGLHTFSSFRTASIKDSSDCNDLGALAADQNLLVAQVGSLRLLHCLSSGLC
ncbi:hypothetical protein WJX74_009701 [Apatococcus lobatus]|uniref:Uncharacterized protein n=1 Tax=Apatococcus lobatus TaxID=904363 RepID=A0AAW1QXX7_9CHLO